MDYTLTKKDVERRLGKSGKTITRYIKNKKLNPVKTKRGNYEIYLFSIEEVVRLEGGHEGGQGTKVGDTPKTQDVKKEDRVNNLYEETQGTKVGDKTDTKDTTGDTGDRTRETQILGLLERTINNLERELEAKNITIKDLTNSLQHEQKETSTLRSMLALPKPSNEDKPYRETGVIIDVGDIRGGTQGTNQRTPRKKKTNKKTKTNKGHKGQKLKSNKKTTIKKKDAKATVSKKEVKDKKEKKRGFFSWIKGE